MSAMLEGPKSYDKITHMLGDGKYGDWKLWKEKKALARRVEHFDGILIFDETVD